ncbi:MAG: DUF1559 domain-containing protein [Planctomycetaceae bacterium]
MAWLIPAVQHAREAARHTQCRGNYAQIRLAFYNYQDAYGCLPPAYIADKDGKPMHSWRVLILPFIDWNDLYKKYNFSEPWNGPNNRQLLHECPMVFNCPSRPGFPDTTNTSYVVVTGRETAFPGSEPISLDDITDGPENTILVVEIADNEIHWMEPRDLKFDEMSFIIDDPTKPSISSPHIVGPAVMFADGGSGVRLQKYVSPESVKAMLTIAGGEEFTIDDLSPRSK